MASLQNLLPFVLLNAYAKYKFVFFLFTSNSFGHQWNLRMKQTRLYFGIAFVFFCLERHFLPLLLVWLQAHDTAVRYCFRVELILFKLGKNVQSGSTKMFQITMLQSLPLNFPQMLATYMRCFLFEWRDYLVFIFSSFNLICRYGDTGFTVNGVKYEGSLLVVDNKLLSWAPKEFSEITPERWVQNLFTFSLCIYIICCVNYWTCQ